MTPVAATKMNEVFEKLLNAGHIRLAFSFAKKYTDLYPDDITAWNSLIDLAHALKDAPILEKALDNWHRLNPAQQHSLVITSILDKLLIDADDEEICELLSMVHKKNEIVNSYGT